MNYLILLVSFFVFNRAYAEVFDFGSSVGFSSVISESRSSVDVLVRNNERFPLFCPELTIDIKVVDGDFDLPSGNLKYLFRNVYVEANSSKINERLAESDVQNLRLRSSGAKISNVSIAGACRKATFADYCNFANLTDEEKNTTSVLMNVFNTRSCNGVKSEGVTYLNLVDSGITHLKPLSFFEDLQRLDLRKNPITDVDALKDLNQLSVVNLNKTSVSDVSPLLLIKGIQKICISKTPLRNLYSDLVAPLFDRCW